MKKLIVILSACFYLVTGLGIGLNMQFCGIKVSEISFLASKKTDCCGKPKDDKKSCCTQIKVSEGQHKLHLKTNTSFSFLSKVVVLPFNNINTFLSNPTDFKLTPKYITMSWHPPSSVKTHILINVFRI